MHQTMDSCNTPVHLQGGHFGQLVVRMSLLTSLQPAILVLFQCKILPHNHKFFH